MITETKLKQINKYKTYALKNHKTLLKEIMEDLNEWKKTSCVYESENNIVKMPVLSKLTYWVNTISIKILAFIFCRDFQSDLISIRNLSGLRGAKIILKTKTKAKTLKESHLPVLKLTKTTIIMTV